MVVFRRHEEMGQPRKTAPQRLPRRAGSGAHPRCHRLLSLDHHRLAGSLQDRRQCFRVRGEVLRYSERRF